MPLPPFPRAVSACAFALLGVAVQAQQAAPVAPGEAKLERVVITGSNIRRVDAETPSPVQILSAEDLKKSGYTSVTEVLHGLAANGMGALTQANASAFAAGASGVSLRGLTVGATLVLIDGHRMAAYAMPDDGQRDFVDIASIPFDTIERIEVLKDGASAVYGSDAIAGVVNVILKKSFKGTAASARLGGSTRGGGATRYLAITHGRGDLDEQGFNAYVALEARHQSPVLLKDRAYLAVSDWSPWGGTPNIFASNDTPNLAGNNVLQVQPATQNLNLLGRFTQQLAGGWQVDLQASVLNSRARQVGVLNDVSAGQQSFAFGPANAQKPAPNPLGNPYIYLLADGATPFTEPLNALGAQTQQSNTTSYRLVLEAAGVWGGWAVDAALGFTRVQTQLRSNNFLSLAGFQAALASGAYEPGQTGISAALRAQVVPPGESTSSNALNFISLRGTRDLMRLGGGALALGAGVEFIQRRLDENFPAAFASGDQYSPIYSFAQGRQSISAAYVELVAPVTRQLELDAAARVDHYDSYGDSVTPKLGFKYSPSRQFTLRGTYAQGFRAPNPAETGKAGSTSGVLNPLYDPLLCPNGNPATALDARQCSLFVTELQLSNPALKPERSDSFTLGIILEPVNWFNISLDYYDITIRDQIIAVGLLGQTQLNTPAAYGAVIYRGAPDASIPGASVGPILYETYPFLNASRTHTAGVDVDLRANFKLDGGGKLLAELNLTRVLRYDMAFGGTTYRFAGTHGPSFISGGTGVPQNRLQARLSWQRGPAQLAGTLNYVSGISVLDPTAEPNTCDFALSGTFPGGVPARARGFCRVPSFTTLNLTAQYKLSPQFTLQAAVTNLLDRRAPYDLQTIGSAGNGAQAGGAAYNPALHQDGAVGRMLSLGVSYTF